MAVTNIRPFCGSIWFVYRLSIRYVYNEAWWKDPQFWFVMIRTHMPLVSPVHMKRFIMRLCSVHQDFACSSYAMSRYSLTRPFHLRQVFVPEVNASVNPVDLVVVFHQLRRIEVINAAKKSLITHSFRAKNRRQSLGGNNLIFKSRMPIVRWA